MGRVKIPTFFVYFDSYVGVKLVAMVEDNKESHSSWWRKKKDDKDDEEHLAQPLLVQKN
jgi:hypothetical protein